MEFTSWQDFENFKKTSIKYNRFIHSQETTKFFSNLTKTFQQREIIISQGKILYRSQIGCNHEQHEGEYIARGFPPERMKPLSNKAREGRANPKGIPYLYLSDDKTTALSEVRPYPGQHLSLAEFETKKNLRIISCNANIINYTYARLTFSPPNSQKEISDAIWSLINDEFSAPIFNSDDTSDYVPTQILAELVKSHDYDGLQFKSSIGEGVNYILFNTDNANQINCKVMTTKSVSYEFSETDGHEYNQNIKQSL